MTGKSAPFCMVTMLWYAICLGICIDTRLFVYLSLSQVLVSGFLILLMAIPVAVHWYKTKERLLADGVQWLVVGWLAYWTFHATCVHSPEIYKLLYLAETLSLLFLLPYLIRMGNMNSKALDNGILFMSAVQIAGLVLQSVGCMNSYNEFFPLTGFSENPNVTAILLAVSIPMVIDRIHEKGHRKFWGVFLVLLCIYVAVLKCRTAFIGLATIGMVRLMFNKKVLAWWRRLSYARRIALCSVLLVSTVALAFVLYSFNRVSADGRMLVWKVSCKMIKEHPMGCGVGMFEHDYNLRQGEYFASGAATSMERLNSGTVYMAYNDFIEQGVECGWLGMAFLSAFYVLLIVKAYRKRRIRELSVLTAFFMMSFTNFICATVQPWLALIACACSLIGNEPMPTRYKGYVTSSVGMVTSSALLFLLCMHTTLTFAQIQLGRLKSKDGSGEKVNLQEVESMSKYIGTSEAYWHFLYEQYYEQGLYVEALQCTQKRMEYTSTPDVFFSAFDCYAQMNQAEKGIPYIMDVARMLPQNLTSRLVLLKWFDSSQKEVEALTMAEEIVRMPIKIKNRRSEEVRNYAKNYIQNHK